MKLRRKILSASTLIVLTAGLLGLSGCKKTPSCELLYKRLDKCMDDFGLKKDKFVKRCKEKKDKPIVKAQIACSKFASCDKFKKCLDESGKKVRQQRMKEDFDKALKSGKTKDALMTCRYSKKHLSDEMKKKCAELQGKEWKNLKAKAIKVRDEGGKNDWSTCNDLKSLADDLGGEAKKKEALGLCAEMAVAKIVAKALKNVQRQQAKPKPSVPLECSWSVNSLSRQKVQTDWMKKQRNAIVDACYKKLGKGILEKWLAGKPRFCSFAVIELYKAIKKYGMDDPTLKGLLAKAGSLCKKDFEKVDAFIKKPAGSTARKPAAGKKAEARK